MVAWKSSPSPYTNTAYENNYHLLSSMSEAAAGVITSSLGQLCQVLLPASLSIDGDCSLRVFSPRYDDHLRVRVGDGAGISDRDD